MPFFADRRVIVLENSGLCKSGGDTLASEVEGGTLYVDGCPSINEASMIIVAKLKKIVITRNANDSDEMCALELLKERNVEVVINPDNLL